jgi:hypothetical protein
MLSLYYLLSCLWLVKVDSLSSTNFVMWCMMSNTHILTLECTCCGLVIRIVGTWLCNYVICQLIYINYVFHWFKIFMVDSISPKLYIERFLMVGLVNFSSLILDPVLITMYLGVKPYFFLHILCITLNIWTSRTILHQKHSR